MRRRTWSEPCAAYAPLGPSTERASRGPHHVFQYNIWTLGPGRTPDVRFLHPVRLATLVPGAPLGPHGHLDRGRAPGPKIRLDAQSSTRAGAGPGESTCLGGGVERKKRPPAPDEPEPGLFTTGLVARMDRAPGDRFSFTSRRLTRGPPAPAALAPPTPPRRGGHSRGAGGRPAPGKRAEGREYAGYGADLAGRSPTRLLRLSGP